MTSAPNILLTNFCNQHCPYCFAQEEMQRSRVKEMSLKNYKKVITILKKNNIDTLRLMGGEPTLHSQFKTIIELGFRHFSHITIFSNGLIPSQNKKILTKYLTKLTFNFNLDTKAFTTNKTARKRITTLITNFVPQAKVNVGFTLFNLKGNYSKLLNDFSTTTLQQLGIRFGLAKALVGQKPFFSKKDYPAIGKKIIQLVKLFHAKKVKNIFLDCGLNKNMFSRSQLRYLTNNVHMKGWGCQGKWSSFDITADLMAFPCFPYFAKLRVALEEYKNSFSRLEDYFKDKKKNCLDQL